MVQIPKKYFYLQYIIKVCVCSLFLFYCLLMKWKITHKNFDVYIIFMKINWKIWISGNPEIVKLATLLLEMFQKYHQLITWNCTGVHIKLYAFTIIFVQTNWKIMKIWQPCNGETGNPVDLGVLKMSPIDFLALNKGVYQFWCLYHHFYGNK